MPADGAGRAQTATETDRPLRLGTVRIRFDAIATLRRTSVTTIRFPRSGSRHSSIRRVSRLGSAQRRSSALPPASYPGTTPSTGIPGSARAHPIDVLAKRQAAMWRAYLAHSDRFPRPTGVRSCPAPSGSTDRTRSRWGRWPPRPIYSSHPSKRVLPGMTGSDPAAVMLKPWGSVRSAAATSGVQERVFV